MHVFSLLWCGLMMPVTADAAETQWGVSVGVDHRITSDRVGSFTMGETTHLYEHYWEQAYFVGNGLRLTHFDEEDLIALLSPKQRVYGLLVGASYQTEKGVRIDDSYKDLRRAYGRLTASPHGLPPGWLYRPDHIDKGDEQWALLSPRYQKGYQALNCAVTSPKLPNVTFYFTACIGKKAVGNIEAIQVVYPDLEDLEWVDPFFTFDTLAACPVSRTADPVALMNKGKQVLYKNRMGEYLNSESVAQGLPMLREALLSGSLEAAALYASVLNTYINQEVVGDPLRRTNKQGASEVLLLNMLSYLRTDVQPTLACDAALLNFDHPMAHSVLSREDASTCGNDYRLGWLSREEIEVIRTQAQAWAACWPKVVLGD